MIVAAEGESTGPVAVFDCCHHVFRLGAHGSAVCSGLLCGRMNDREGGYESWLLSCNWGHCMLITCMGWWCC